MHIGPPDDANLDCCGRAVKLLTRTPRLLCLGIPKPAADRNLVSPACHYLTGQGPHQWQPPSKSQVASLVPPTSTAVLYPPGDCGPDMASIDGRRHRLHAAD